jgi:hypothetical protein
MLVEPSSGIRQLVKMRSHVVCACAELDGLSEWLFGIVPCYNSGQLLNVGNYMGDIPWSIILNIVFLDFLDVVVRLRIIHPFRTVVC